MRVDEDELLDSLEQARPDGHHLFAYPAQSNFSGVQHPLKWIAMAQARGWDVVLDAAAFVATNRLDLGLWHPDFVPLSFYKMFRLPHRCWLLAGAARGTRQTASPMVRWWHYHRRLRARRPLLFGRR